MRYKAYKARLCFMWSLSTTEGTGQYISKNNKRTTTIFKNNKNNYTQDTFRVNKRIHRKDGATTHEMQHMSGIPTVQAATTDTIARMRKMQLVWYRNQATNKRRRYSKGNIASIQVPQKASKTMLL